MAELSSAKKLERDQSVFLNVPYHEGYEDLFVAMITGLVAHGRTPVCALKVSERGEGRMRKILEMLEGCALSIHDLSCVGTPARFNMPFELGIAYAMRYQTRNHEFVLFEKEPFRLDRTLSDIKGHDPHIHRGRPTVLIGCLVDLLGSKPDVSQKEVETVWRQVKKHVNDHKKTYRVKTVFTSRMFGAIVTTAVGYCEENGLLKK